MSEKWSNSPFCAERETEIQREIKRERDKESQRGKQKMVLLLKHKRKLHDGFAAACVYVCVCWQEM